MRIQVTNNQATSPKRVECCCTEHQHGHDSVVPHTNSANIQCNLEYDVAFTPKLISNK